MFFSPRACSLQPSQNPLACQYKKLVKSGEIPWTGSAGSKKRRWRGSASPAGAGYRSLRLGWESLCSSTESRHREQMGHDSRPGDQRIGGYPSPDPGQEHCSPNCPNSKGAQQQAIPSRSEPQLVAGNERQERPQRTPAQNKDPGAYQHGTQRLYSSLVFRKVDGRLIEPVCTLEPKPHLCSQELDCSTRACRLNERPRVELGIREQEIQSAAVLVGEDDFGLDADGACARRAHARERRHGAAARCTRRSS
jgi:hypothetical protein